MDLTADFAFRPLPPIEPDTAAISPAAAGGSPLGQLANLSGSWSGMGFNLIWRPHHPGQDQAAQDRPVLARSAAGGR